MPLAPGLEPVVARLEELTEGGGSGSYPQEMRSAYKVLEFAGPGKGGTGGVWVEGARVGMMTLPAGFHYPLHAHPSPEVYVVVSGTGTWETSGACRVSFRPSRSSITRHSPRTRSRRGPMSLWSSCTCGGAKEA